jgi:hypothetical protein
MDRGKLLRWMAPLAAGGAFFLGLCALLLLRFRLVEAGLAAWLSQGFMVRPVKVFAAQFALTLMLPTYVFFALLLWGLALAWTSLWVRPFSRNWTPREGFGITLASLLWVHLCLWWEVPSTLWLLPGLRSLPFWAAFPLLLGLVLLYPVLWLRRRRPGWFRGTLILGGWLALWSLVPWVPQVLPRLFSPARGGDQETRVLMVGLDGLRADVGYGATRAFEGTTYTHAYTVLPATRLLWHILWGGDPLYYTVGHAPPALEEFSQAKALPLVDEAAEKGWKPRFYIDDGGTVGLIGRPLNFDDVLMPAPGWENFVNSNLSASFPLFAAWENWGRAFPTTNPWASLDGGLRETLRLGRGSRWVMFHSCLAHQPIFLTRRELAQLPHWWSAVPANLEPYSVKDQVSPERAARYDSRRDPFAAYRIRMQSILRAWEPIWNGLAQDPQYRNAVRILFSDHGERFYHVTPEIQLAGVHGFGIDPWEARIMFLATGPGLPSGRAREDGRTLSLLGLRDALEEAIRKDRALVPETMTASHTVAPLRYQTIGVELFAEEPAEYRHMDMKSVMKGTAIAPGGIWFTEYEKSAEERASEVTVAWGTGDHLDVVKPLKAGGAHRYSYDGYDKLTITALTEAEYVAEREKMAKALKPIPPR